MATHSSVLAWRIPGTGEPGGLPSMGSHRVGHDWSDLAAAAFDIDGFTLGLEESNEKFHCKVESYEICIQSDIDSISELHFILKEKMDILLNRCHTKLPNFSYYNVNWINLVYLAYSIWNNINKLK